MSTISTELSGVKVELQVPRRVPAETPTRCTITMTNTREDPVRFLRKGGGNHMDYKISVIDRERRPCARTEYGRWHLIREPVEVGGSAGVNFLKQGEKFVWEIDLNQCFQLPVGKLSATLQIDAFAHESEQIRLTCKDCAFEVTP